ncbi:hypothetical protein CPHO_08230 [Corynebacterium phocae]|uniref:Uncharacterized protein n=1 Tax=Corynebacterium phocae TaxID=161895 RepID=A0A1L7D4E1_9CORY|nr:hypothetical protein [Corynebacterium phocae]APT92873.1 hypothetical protein CPHO_08230 [Corynebacterium phocae]KAA8723195.1 hypothetical protein F4V58_07735 [Corynebacterium phocae]
MNTELTRPERKFNANILKLAKAIRRSELAATNAHAEWPQLRVGDQSLRALITKDGYNLHKFLGKGQPAGDTILEGELKNARAEIGAYMLEAMDLTDSAAANEILNAN